MVAAKVFATFLVANFGRASRAATICCGLCALAAGRGRQRQRALVRCYYGLGLVLFTDGGSNKIRSQTGWGVVVLQKNSAA